MKSTSHSFSQDGFETIPSVLTEKEVKDLRTSLRALEIAPGCRNLRQRVSDVAALAESPKVLGLLRRLLRERPFPVRSIFFDKVPQANWLVPWHQDLSIAVKKRIEIPGYGPWSTKDGVPHVQPPAEILETMVTFRLHLDDCDESNGALRVLPGSHRSGRLDAGEIAGVRSRQTEVVCSAGAGDALLMRPLLLHASSEALNPAHRRVIHLEYAVDDLPGGLEWFERPAEKFALT